MLRGSKIQIKFRSWGFFSFFHSSAASFSAKNYAEITFFFPPENQAIIKEWLIKGWGGASITSIWERIALVWVTHFGEECLIWGLFWGSVHFGTNSVIWGEFT